MKKIITTTLIVFLVIILLYIKVTQHNPPGRPKGQNAAIKGNLANIRAQSNLIYKDSTPHSYKEVCSNEIITKFFKNIKDNSGESTKCFSDIDSFIVTAKFKKPDPDGSMYYCVDSTGNLKSITPDKESLVVTADSTCI